MFDQYFSSLGSSLLDLSSDQFVSILHSSSHANTSVSFKKKWTNPQVTAVFLEKGNVFGFSHNDEETEISVSRDLKRFNPTFSIINYHLENKSSYKVHVPYIFGKGKIVFSDLLDYNGHNNIKVYAKGHHSFRNVAFQCALIAYPSFSCSLYMNYINTVLYSSFSTDKNQFKWQHSNGDLLYFLKISENKSDDILTEKPHYTTKGGILMSTPSNAIGAYIKPQNNIINIRSILKRKNYKIATNLIVDNYNIIPNVAVKFFRQQTKYVFGVYGKTNSIINELTVPFGKNNTFKILTNFDYTRQNATSCNISINLEH